MRELDGDDAGGQFVRTALALSALENEPIRLRNVRGNRSTPGLRLQHLAVLETMAAICDGEATGTTVGAETITFDPDLDDGIFGGTYEVDIDTAGSVSLLFDALLPLATTLEEPLSITATGGTDVAWSPPIEYLSRVKLPLVRSFGLHADCEIDRRGFYPAGGGRATLRLYPSTLEPIGLAADSSFRDVHCYSTESASLAGSDVASRQAQAAIERLTESPLPTSGEDGEPDGERLEIRTRQLTTADSDSPGSVILLVLEGKDGIAGFSALGERGKPAERVGTEAAESARAFLERRSTVDRHMADQLLVFLALAGGRVRVPASTDHVESSADLLERFDVSISSEQDGETVVLARESS